MLSTDQFIIYKIEHFLKIIIFLEVHKSILDSGYNNTAIKQITVFINSLIIYRDLSNYDWGFSQLDSVMDRKEISGSHFLVLTNFGDHCLHHLFPTLDHGLLEHLYPVFEKVMEKYDVNLRMVSQLDTIKGGFQQLMRVTPNDSPPDLKKYVKKNK